MTDAEPRRVGRAARRAPFKLVGRPGREVPQAVDREAMRRWPRKGAADAIEPRLARKAARET